jgi:hypothetical protein
MQKGLPGPRRIPNVIKRQYHNAMRFLEAYIHTLDWVFVSMNEGVRVVRIGIRNGEVVLISDRELIGIDRR